MWKEVWKQIWTQSDMSLYSELIEWRMEVAKKEGIMPATVCSLDLLVLMAYKRPGRVLTYLERPVVLYT